MRLLGREQPLDQLVGRSPLPDERMGEQGLARVGRIAAERRADGEPLVRRHVLREAEQLRCERCLRQRDGYAVLDARRDLDDVVGGEPRERALVPDVDLVQLAGAGSERCHEARRRFAVERAAPLLQQRRLLVDFWIAVELEQLPLDLGHDGRARGSAELLGEHGVVRVEVAEVVGRNRPELLEQLPRQRHLGRELVAVLGEQRREHVGAGDANGSDPREVVEADLIDLDVLRGDAEQRRQATLEPDRDVAETDRAMTRVEHGPRDDPDRVREVDDPRAGGRALAHSLGDVEYDRDCAQRLGEPACARGLLPDAAAEVRNRLVRETRRLPADADLDEHEVGAVDGAVEVVRDEQLAAESLAAPACAPPCRRRSRGALHRCRAARAR